MTKLGFQMYSLHAVDDSLPDVLERIGETPFEGVEFAGLGDATPEELSSALDRSGLACAGAHVGVDDVEEHREETFAAYESLDCRDLAVAYMPPESFESAAAVDELAGRFDAITGSLADHSVGFHYHNHDHEFVDVDGTPALERLIERTDDVGIEVDLGWVGAAGHDPIEFLERHADRIGLAHLKDYDETAGETVKVGTGDLDVETVVEVCRRDGVEWLIYEAEGNPDSYETLAHAADVVEPYI